MSAKLKEILIRECSIREEQLDRVISMLPDIYKVEEYDDFLIRNIKSTVKCCLPENDIAYTYKGESELWFDVNYFQIWKDGTLGLRPNAPSGKIPQPKGYTNYTALFCNVGDCYDYDISDWDVSNITCMRNMFMNCSATSFGDLSNWDVSNVADMSNMFASCETENFGDLSNWDVSHVTDMSNMFTRCKIKTLGCLANWDVSKVTTMSGMFSYCAIEGLDLSKWNVSNVVNMCNLFCECTSASVGDLSQWDVSKVDNIACMFYGCRVKSFGDISGWNVANVGNKSCTFFDCKDTYFGDVSKWDNVMKVTNVDNFVRNSNNSKGVLSFIKNTLFK